MVTPFLLGFPVPLPSRDVFCLLPQIYLYKEPRGREIMTHQGRFSHWGASCVRGGADGPSGLADAPQEQVWKESSLLPQGPCTVMSSIQMCKLRLEKGHHWLKSSPPAELELKPGPLSHDATLPKTNSPGHWSGLLSPAL